MPDANTYYQQNLRDIIGGTMPSFKRSRQDQYDFLLQNALRTGQSAASAASAVRPFADAAGDAAAKAGIHAKQMATQQEQFDIGQSNFEKKFAEMQKQWQATFDQRNRDQEFANMMNLYQRNGIMTPEMLDAFGYGDISRGDMRNVQRQMELLGIGGGGGINAGFNRPNPALQKLGLQGGSSFSGGGGGGGASYSTLSSPSNPFRRVDGAGQGPGLMRLRPTR
jgi:hypothetical protein